MKEEISFETAKLAKEKGFDWKCSKYYRIYGVELEFNELRHAKFGVHESGFGHRLSGGEHENIEEDPLEISAPTQSLLQRWLRELSTPIIVNPTTDFVAWECEVHHPDKGFVRLTVNKENKWFDSYEEALEEGLQKALELI